MIDREHVLLLGSGSRENALAIAFKDSPHLGNLYCAPGNAGIAQVALCVPLDILDPGAVVAFCKEHDVTFLVIGPEEPMFRGVADAARAEGIDVFEFSKSDAQLEADKVFAKRKMLEWGVPTPMFRVANTLDEALEASHELGFPERAVFWKAWGSAAGKGAYPVRTFAEMSAAIVDLFVNKRFGDQTLPILVEEGVFGDEKSIFVTVSSHGYQVLEADTQDYKRRDDGDKGLNTGGMGARSPSKGMTDRLWRRIDERVIRRTIAGMRQDRMHGGGVQFFGIVVNDDGAFLYEYNVRFGDPEATVLLMRVRGDVLALLMSVARDQFYGGEFAIDPRPALSVVLCGPDYPSDTGRIAGEITGIEDARSMGVEVLHAGTKIVDGKLIGGKGRVLAVRVQADTIADARRIIYAAIAEIKFQNGMHFRTDIGL